MTPEPGRPPLPQEERAQNTVFRLKPNVDAALSFIVGAGNYRNRTDALSALVMREAKRLGRDELASLAGRVAQRAHDAFQETRPVGRLNRARILLRSYILEVEPGARDYAINSPHDVAFATDHAAFAASLEALDWIASNTPAELVANLESLGVRAGLQAERGHSQIFLALGGSRLEVRPSIPK